MKEKYTEYAKQTFKGKALDLVLSNINLFYEDNISINKSKYYDYRFYIKRFIIIMIKEKEKLIYEVRSYAR